MYSFNGFEPRLIPFLNELHFNNTPETQSDNLVLYRKLITEPLNELYFSLLPTVEDSGLPFETKKARCVSTPYTDRRFSPNVPLKEYMYLRFKLANRVNDVPGLYFDLGAFSYGCGIRVYNATSRGESRLRERIAEASPEFSKRLDAVLAASFSVKGTRYKRDRCPEIDLCSAKDLINTKSFYIERAKPVDGSVFSPALAYELSDAFRLLSELLELFI